MKTISNNRTWIEISKRALYHNIDQLQELIGASSNEAPLLGCVVKANAYGHGAHQIGMLLNENSSVSFLFTATTSEAIELRNYGVTKPIAVMSYYDTSYEDALRADIDLVVYDCAIARKLDAIAQQYGIIARVHIKVDTGLSRFGFHPDELPGALTQLTLLKNIKIVGLFSHFSDLNIDDLTYTYTQIASFDRAYAIVNKAGIYPYTHMLSSGALALNLTHRYTLTRIGTSMYGFWKNELQKKRFLEKKPDFILQQVLTWKTRIVHIKNISAHSYIGYNRAAYTHTPITVALLPVGYYDGYPRALTNKSSVLIHGKKAPIIGIVSMSILVADITHITANIGDEVILCGNYEGIMVNDFAEAIGTISNEFAARINPLIPRIIVE